jgi:hypothetical protein
VTGRPGVCEGPSGGGATYLLPGLVEANVRRGVPLKMIVFSNSVYGWIKARQKTGFLRFFLHCSSCKRSGGKCPCKLTAALVGSETVGQRTVNPWVRTDFQRRIDSRTHAGNTLVTVRLLLANSRYPPDCPSARLVATQCKQAAGTLY